MEVGRVEAKISVDSTDFDKGINDAGQTLEGFGSRFKGLFDSMTTAMGTFAGNLMTSLGGTLVDGFATATGAVFDFAKDSEQATKDLAAALGLPADEVQRLGDVANRVFANNFGADISEATSTLGEVRKQLGDMSDQELQSITEDAFRMKDAFGLEVPESINTVKTLMQQFGLTSDQAFDFVAKGFQSGLNSSDDFIDTINEYSNQFAASGLSANEFFSSLETGLQGGVLGTDKIADAFKESRIRIQEWGDDTLQGMRDVANEGFGDQLAKQLGVADVSLIDMGKNADQVAQFFKNNFGVDIDPAELAQPFDILNATTGETETRLMNFGEVFDKHVLGGFEKGTVSVGDLQKTMITGLQQMDGSIRQNSAGVKIFGTMWEDATAQGILQVDLTKTSLEDLAGATDKVDQKYSSLSQVWEGVKRSALVAFSPIADQILGLANDFMPLLTAAFQDLGTWIQTVVSGGVALFEQIKPLIESVFGFFQQLIGFDVTSSIFGMGTDVPLFGMLTELKPLWEGLWSGIQNTINQILPDVQNLITTAFTTIHDFITNNMSTIQTIIQGAWDIIKGIFDAAGLFIQNVITPVFTWIVDFVMDHMEQIKAVLQAAWNVASNIVQTAIDIIKGIIQTVTALIKGDWEGVWEGIKKTFQAVWDGIGNILSAALDYIKTILSAAWNIISDAVASAWRGIQNNILIPILEAIKNVFTSAGNGIKDFLSGIWNSITDTVRNVWNGIKDIISGVWDSISDGVSNAIDAVLNVVNGAKSALEGAFSGAFEGISNIITNIMRGTVNVIIDIINGIIEATNSLIDGLNAVNPFEDVPHIPLIPHYASGTDYHKGGLAIVGEKGPELITLPRGTSVTPNDKLQGMGNTYVLNVYTNRDATSIIEEYDFMKATRG